MKENNTEETTQSSLEEIIGKLDNFSTIDNERQLYKAVITKIEKVLIEKVLARTYGNKLRAARILGLNRNTLHAKIRKLGIEVRRWKD